MSRRRNQKEAENRAPLEQAVSESTVKVAPTPLPEELSVDFDTWYAMRKTLIPAQHYKEIIKADFKGRKVPMLAPLSIFDEALKKYGISL